MYIYIHISCSCRPSAAWDQTSVVRFSRAVFAENITLRPYGFREQFLLKI